MDRAPIAPSTGISKDETNPFSSHEETDLFDGKLTKWYCKGHGEKEGGDYLGPFKGQSAATTMKETTNCRMYSRFKGVNIKKKKKGVNMRGKKKDILESTNTTVAQSISEFYIYSCCKKTPQKPKFYLLSFINTLKY